MADEPNDVQDGEITLEDFNADEVPAKPESSPAKEEPKEVTPEPKAEEKKEPVKGDDTPADKPEVSPTEEEDKKPEGEEPEDKDVEEPEDKPSKADERKTQLNTEIRDLVARRNAIRDEVTKANSEVYAPQTEEELIESGMSATDAKVEAMRQSMEMRDYNERISEAQLTLSTESERVLREFPQFNPESGDETYNKELAEGAAQLLQANLIVDQNSGQIIGSHISPYAMYKLLDQASGVSETKGQIKGQQAAQEMAANADTPAAAAPTKKPTDPLMALWTEED